ncbi:hypothetical protein [Leptospira kirschneri]|uniref:hypothetical protein n=1 Tax=Leptospira kirschneri TaxID=29507 RepID=UPI0004A31D66|nr:hypothetical protein [Leptospira kirschneri]
MALKTRTQNDFDLTEIINGEEHVTTVLLAPSSKTCCKTFSHNSKIFGKTSGQRNDLISHGRNFRRRIQSDHSKKSIVQD